MKYDYYIHDNLSYYHNYFNTIGKPRKVSRLVYQMNKVQGYRATKVPAGTSTVEVYVQAAIDSGAHPTSWKIEKIRENGYDTGR